MFKRKKMKTFGEKIKELRKERGLTQPALAKELDVSNGMISNWENNINEPGLTHIKNIATFFNVSADYIVGIK